MKFKIAVPGVSRFPLRDSLWDADMRAPDYQRFARRAEALGYDSLYVSEHIVVPVEHGPVTGYFWPHALAAMSFLAGATERVRVDSNVIVLPYHNPLNLAKQAATVDVLCGGRLTLSIGIGNSKPEFAALGVPYEKRGRIADEMIKVMKVLWTEERPSFRGEFFSFDGVVFEPKPVQKPHPPLWIGGSSKAAMRRAVRFGDGWTPNTYTADEIRECIQYMQSLPEWTAREAPLEISVRAVPRNLDSDHRPIASGAHRETSLAMPTQELVDIIGGYERVGVSWIILPVRGARSFEEHMDMLERLAQDVVAKFRK